MSNLNRTKLNHKKIGVVFGTFAPLHLGHQQTIYKAAAENDGVVVIVSGYKGDRGDKIGLNLEKRFRLLRETFQDESDIRIQYIDETNIPKYPYGWSVWTKLLEEKTYSYIDDESSKDFTVYVGEEEYKDKLNEFLPSNWKVIISNRKNIPISATEIRENPIKHWNYISRTFRAHFTKKVLVVGSASTGKSTLVRRLARSFGAPFSEEYARTYEEEFNIDDNELRVQDYFHFIQGQFDANRNELKSPSNQGLVIFDTDAIVTRVYSELYLEKDEQEKLEPFFQEMIKKEEFDLILVIPPITKYVDDGFRAMEWEDSRFDFHNSLLRQLKEFGFEGKIVLLDDNDEDGGYYKRYIQSIKEINKLDKEISVPILF